jgi:hypothetical protein
MVMTVRYGNYTFTPGECTMARIEYLPHYCERGRRDLNRFRITLQGQLGGCSEADITAKINDFLNAFDKNGKELALYDSNGVKTRHYLSTNEPAIVQSPRVEYQSWPEGGRGQYQTVRDFTVVMQGMSIGDEAVLTEYSETIRNIGISYGIWRLVMTQFGPRFKLTYPQGPQIVIQEGHAVGLLGWYLGPPLYTPVGPTWKERAAEHEENPITPMLVGDPLGHYPFLYYPSTWRYVWDFTTSNITYPIPV